MLKRRLLKTLPILASLAAIILTACGQSSEPTPDKLRAQLRAAEQRLEQVQMSLGAAQRRIAVMLEERTRDQKMLAERTANATRLEQGNRDLAEQLARARERLARITHLNGTLRQQHDQSISRVSALSNERRMLHENLARANDEIRRLQARQSPDQRRLAELYQRGNLAAREVEELRRYNGFLLQERGNLQAWLAEANAARQKHQQNALRAQEEAARIQSEQAAAQAASGKLRAQLEQARAELATLEHSRDALADELASLRATVNRVAESQRRPSEQLEKALAHASAPGTAHDRKPAESQQAAAPGGDAAALRAELDEAREKIARLRVARDYLVEKVEACTAGQPAARTDPTAPPARLAWLPDLPSRAAAPSTRPLQPEFMTARWPLRSGDGLFGSARLVKVASAEADQAKVGRREKELNETRQKLKKLTQDHATLKKDLQALESACAEVRQQVQTLTWANEVLVKELDAAYASSGTPAAHSLPEGTRGMYLLRQGESLSRVAKAFYDDPGRWTDIVEANKAQIPDPDRVKAGTLILIPE